MNPMLRDAVLRPLFLVVVLGLLVGCLKVLTAWWRGDVKLGEDGNWIWLLLFPILLFAWWRYLSVFGCKEASCLLPKDDERRN